MDLNLPPHDYSNKINEIEVRINLILDELKNTYVNYKLYPDVSEYQNVYLNNKQNLDNAKNDIFLLKNYLQSNLINKNKEIKEKGEIIDNLKKENSELNNRYKSLLLGNNAAIGLNNQQSGLYTLSRYNLILTIIGILCISYVTTQAFNLKGNEIKESLNNISKNITNSISLPFNSNENKVSAPAPPNSQPQPQILPPSTQISNQK